MYPLADVPVLQLSIPTSDPLKLLALGARLRPLRETGVLVIGSGFLTHGLPFLTPAMITLENAVPGWSADFDVWAAEALARGDVETPGELPARARDAVRAPDGRTTSCRCSSRWARPPTRQRRCPPVSTGYWMGLAKRSFQVSSSP